MTGALVLLPDAVSRFLVSRWQGAVPIRRLFGTDMLIVGTAINLATGLAALAMLAAKSPLWAVLTVYMLPLPYNVFLTTAVWRTAESQLRGMPALGCQLAAVLWLFVATLI